MIGRRLLASALGLGLLASMTMRPAGAVARDLPRGAAAPPVIEPCAVFGPGFVQIAGSQTCVRIGGSVTIESSIVSRGRGVGSFLSGSRR